MHYLSVVLAPRFLVVLLAVLFLLLLMVALFLVQAHLGGTPALVQSTEAILQ